MLEPVLALLIFSFVLVVANNGIVYTIQQQWSNAARAAALAGARVLYEKSENPTVASLAVNEALSLALLHSWLGRPMDAGQVLITLGVWENCLFTPTTISPNACRVDINGPTDEGGNPIGITAFFGRINVPMFAPITTQTAVAGLDETTALLVEYQGEVCQ